VDLGLTGCTALVCASTSGLGEAPARALAAEGARVVVSGRRAERAEAIAAELPDAVGVGVDLSADGAPEQLVAAAGDVDVLVPVPLLLAQQHLVSLVLPGMRERSARHGDGDALRRRAGAVALGASGP
jgi:3-oxoacyl-[acyl-carrier protein] reductase